MGANKTETLSPILQAAASILAAAKSELHVNEISKRAVNSNTNLGLKEDEFAAKLSGALAANLKTKAPAFAKPLNKQGRPRKGIYRLKQTKTPSVVGKAQPPSVSSLFLGKAGEFAVASELLFWGFNVSLMAVDQGVDLVAEKGGKFRHIQVKTSATSADGLFSFAVQQKVFEAVAELAPWYVFVMRNGRGTDYAVIPHSHLLNLRTLGVIGGRDLSIQIVAQDKGRRYEMNNRDDISLFINNFGII